MKKKVTMFVSLALSLSLLAACGPKEPVTGTMPPAPSEPPVETTGPITVDPMTLSVEEKLAYASGLSDADLFELAKKETGKMMVYSTTSICETALNTFLERYPGLSAEFSSVGEADMFTKLTTEIGTAAQGADMALLQNAYRMENELLSEGLLLNYFSDQFKDTVPQEYWEPCAVLFSQKLFIYNSTGGNIGLDNVWQLTEKEFADKIFFKDPSSEPVGMNFLVMLTGDLWAGKLADAYKAYYGTDWNNTANYANAGYEFLDGFLKNCNYTYAADGGIAEGVSTGAAGNVGLFVFSKLRSASVDRDNLSIAATAAEGGEGMVGFSGFIYPTYAQICKDTDMPFTCALFINWLFTEEGFAAWNNENNMGVYSPNMEIPLVPDATGLDKEIGYWLNCLVIEDGVTVAEKYPEAYEFISIRLS